jgi:rhodanese-related sulfurtransferase
VDIGFGIEGGAQQGDPNEDPNEGRKDAIGYHFTLCHRGISRMSFIVNNWMLELIMLLSGGMLLWPLVQKRFSGLKEVGTVQAIQLINRQNAVLLDLREDKEFEGGHLPNAVHIPLSALGSRGSELAKLTARPIVAYCDRGQRARAAGGALTKLGFAEVFLLTGGFRAWKEAGLPVAK